MGEPRPKIDFDIVEAVYLACAEFPTRARLDHLQLAWLAVASNGRTEALMVPGGFATEQARQLEQLHTLADLVAADVPDLEMERVARDGDTEGMLRRAQQLFARGRDVQ